MITPVPKKYLHLVWDSAREHLLRFEKRSGCQFTVDEIGKSIFDGEQQLWILVDEEEKITALRNAVKALPGYPEYYIFAPYPRMYPNIALSAWSVVQYLEEPDLNIMTAFANAYRGQGPEPGAPSCAPGGGM